MIRNKGILKEKLLMYYGLGTHNKPSNPVYLDRYFAQSIQNQFSRDDINTVIHEIEVEYGVEL